MSSYFILFLIKFYNVDYLFYIIIIISIYRIFDLHNKLHNKTRDTLENNTS